MDEVSTLGRLLWGTLSLRPYVFVFLGVFLLAAGRDLGPRRAAAFLGWAWAVAFGAEWTSTRVGVPFGLYHYTGETSGVELYLSNVPLFDSLSFPFVAYAAFCLARRALGEAPGAAVPVLGGVLMMLLDVVIDPLAVRGERWFLGRIFYYPEGGFYFGVPLSNFAGWWLVGWIIMNGFALAAARQPRPPGPTGPGIALYYGLLAFTLAVTAWIGEWVLLAAGILVHAGGFLLLYVTGALGAARRRAAGAPDPPAPDGDGSRWRRARVAGP